MRSYYIQPGGKKAYFDGMFAACGDPDEALMAIAEELRSIPLSENPDLTAIQKGYIRRRSDRSIRYAMLREAGEWRR